MLNANESINIWPICLSVLIHFIVWFLSWNLRGLTYVYIMYAACLCYYMDALQLKEAHSLSTNQNHFVCFENQDKLGFSQINF